MVYKILLRPITNRFKNEGELVRVSFASDSLPVQIDFFSDLAARRMLLDFLRVCGYRLSDYQILSVESYSI